MGMGSSQSTMLVLDTIIGPFRSPNPEINETCCVRVCDRRSVYVQYNKQQNQINQPLSVLFRAVI